MKPRILALSTASAVLLASAILSGCAATSSGPSNPAAITSASGEDKLPKKADLLFVQNAERVRYQDGTLTLCDVNPVTVAFADRPVRFAGHMPTRHFVPMWSQGKDSFLKDPPNATLSVLAGGEVSNAVVVLRNPRMSGDDLSYDVEVLEGTPPARGGAASLFIDVIGMPRTPYSYAGAARRDIRTPAVGLAGPAVVHYGGVAVVGAPVYGPTVVAYGGYIRR